MIPELTFFKWLNLLIHGYWRIRFYTDYSWPVLSEEKPFIGYISAYYDGYLWIAWIGSLAIEGTP